MLPRRQNQGPAVAFLDRVGHQLAVLHLVRRREQRGVHAHLGRVRLAVGMHETETAVAHPGGLVQGLPAAELAPAREALPAGGLDAFQQALRGCFVRHQDAPDLDAPWRVEAVLVLVVVALDLLDRDRVIFGDGFFQPILQPSAQHVSQAIRYGRLFLQLAPLRFFRIEQVRHHGLVDEGLLDRFRGLAQRPELKGLERRDALLQLRDRDRGRAHRHHDVSAVVAVRPS